MKGKKGGRKTGWEGKGREIEAGERKRRRKGRKKGEEEKRKGIKM